MKTGSRNIARDVAVMKFEMLFTLHPVVIDENYKMIFLALVSCVWGRRKMQLTQHGGEFHPEVPHVMRIKEEACGQRRDCFFSLTKEQYLELQNFILKIKKVGSNFKGL